MERKKVIFQEPNREPTAITGEIEDSGDFLKVRNEKGILTINKKLILVIKNASGGGQE